MILLDVPQGGKEWIDARLGIPTASQFHRILTPKTMKLSASAEGYACELIAERWLGQPLDESVTAFIQRGHDLEASAVAFYELQQDVEAKPVGFIYRDDRRSGCSPDRTVGTDGLVEIKCPSAPVHIGYMLDVGADKYNAQVQGQLWITERSWVDWLSFNPDLPPVLKRIHRDEVYITALAAAVAQFNEYLGECQEKLVSRGYMEAVKRVA